jgi:7,8-dihydroneopterin aldolase/epimerase/oxygenase
MPDRILIQGIQFYGYHGVHAEERKLGQLFQTDVELRLDLRAAGQRDDLAASVDYGQVSAAVMEVGTRDPCKLLERLAERIAAALLERFSVEQVTVRVTKPHPPLSNVIGGVSVEITRP